jgi:hypothetical protein
MTLTKNTKEDIKRTLIIAAGISPDYFTKKIKAMHDLQKALFELTGGDYKALDKELTEIIAAAADEIEAIQAEKTA